MCHICGLRKRNQYGANSTLKSISKWLAVKLCPLDKWWLLAAHYLAIRASLNWHLVPNWSADRHKNTSALKWRKFDCRLASSWISIYTHTDPVRNVCASWHRTRVRHVRTCLISAVCVSKLDHSFLTSLLVGRGVGLSFPSFIPNTLWELWSLCYMSFFFSCFFCFFFHKTRLWHRCTQVRGGCQSWLRVAGGLVVRGEWAARGESWPWRKCLCGSSTMLVRRHVELYTHVRSQTSRNQYGHPNSAFPDSYIQ